MWEMEVLEVWLGNEHFMLEMQWSPTGSDFCKDLRLVAYASVEHHLPTVW